MFTSSPALAAVKVLRSFKRRELKNAVDALTPIKGETGLVLDRTVNEQHRSMLRSQICRQVFRNGRIKREREKHGTHPQTITIRRVSMALFLCTKKEYNYHCVCSIYNWRGTMSYKSKRSCVAHVRHVGVRRGWELTWTCFQLQCIPDVNYKSYSLNIYKLIKHNCCFIKYC